jgi:trigger factor
MMSDRKYVENTYFQLQTDKLFRYVETQINPTEQPISVEAFTDMVKNHHH